ncbi:hypothetical protein GOV11_02030 [Candidatus Woesearchaeota archaeon]|nr:hypothetical protein [Candidatus Woesearchaeota archaeon]
MDDDVIRTGVDDLLDYLRDKEKVAMQDAATVLGISHHTLQAWVDFLVEEKIIGIEYKFTKPYIYLNKDDPKLSHKGKILEGVPMNPKEIKKEYFDRATAKKIPEQKITQLWQTHILDALNSKREYFIEQATKRGAQDPVSLWEDYRMNLLARF